MSNINIVVYAICKNEEKFVDRWYEFVKEADEIIVVDTGSTDNTIAKLKQHEKIHVIEKTFNPWRFDHAKNYAKNYAMVKCGSEDDLKNNVYVSIDLDEIFEEPGWSDYLRSNWDPEKHTRASFKYVWSHDDLNFPERVFYLNKIHDYTWYWKFPVHEMLYRGDNKTSPEYSSDECLYTPIVMHHFPDNDKSRSSYLDLLKLRFKENPNDPWSKLYLLHEYYYNGMYKECINFGITYINPIIETDFNELEQANIMMFLGNAYNKIGERLQAISMYNAGIIVDPLYRENYLRLAECYNELGNYNMAFGTIKECLSKSKRRYNWLEQDTSWTYDVYDILSISLFYLGFYDDSYEMIKKAIEIDPFNDRFIENKALIEEKIIKRKE